MLFVHRVIAGGPLLARLLALDHFAADQAGNDAVDLVILVGGFLAGTGDDQRRARFVDQDRVHFIDDGEVEHLELRALAVDGGHRYGFDGPLDALGDPELHVVAQVVEAEFVVGAVGDVGGVAVAALAIVQIVHDDADGHAQALVDPAHPFRVALGQIIVDRDHVHALPRERVQVNRQRRDQRLAFAGLHFGDLAAVQDDAADQLDIEVPHVEDAAAGFAHGGEGGDQKIVERRALRDLLLELDGLRGQFLDRRAPGSAAPYR